MQIILCQTHEYRRMFNISKGVFLSKDLSIMRFMQATIFLKITQHWIDKDKVRTIQTIPMPGLSISLLYAFFMIIHFRISSLDGF